MKVIDITPEYLASQGLSPTFAERFWKKVFILEYGCWLWTNGKKRYGYITKGLFRGALAAHRASWILHFGPIPNNLNVLHKCDVPLCVNPDHLFLGTQFDNVQDCIQKGRHLMVRLSKEIVVSIRDGYKGRYGEQSEIARRLGITSQAVGRIVRRQNWKHI